MKTKILSRIIKLGIISLFLTFSTTAVASATDFYWVNAGGDNLWTNTSNWSLTAGGAGGAGSPSLVDKAIFTSDVTANATINLSNLFFQDLIVQRGYTGTITGTAAATYSVNTINIADGTVDLTGITSLSVSADAVIDGGSLLPGNSARFKSNTYINHTAGGGSYFDGSFLGYDTSAVYFGESGGNLYIGQSGSSGSVQNFSTDELYLYGDFIQATDSGTSIAGTTSQVHMDGTGAQSITAISTTSFGNLVIGASSNTTINSDILVSSVSGSGIFNAGSYTITTLLGWDSASLTFNAGTSTVILGQENSNITIFGSNTFYNLTRVSSTSRNLTIVAGTTQTINGTLTLTGVAGDLINLQSSSAGNQYTIDVASVNVDASYVNAQDLNATNNFEISDGFDSGNNTLVFFTTSGSPAAVPEFSTYMLFLVLIGGMYMIYKQSNKFQKITLR